MILATLNRTILHFLIEQHSIKLRMLLLLFQHVHESTSLVEIISVELKFTIDTLNDWFSNATKPKFIGVNDIKKQVFVKENTIVLSKTTCSICWFLLDVQAEGENKRWYNFIVECECLLLRDIYNNTDLQKNEHR